MARFAPRYARPRRSVRLHLDGNAPSIEGVLIGRWRGMFVLENPRVLSAVDKSHALEGYVEIPQSRVAFLQFVPPPVAARAAPAALPWVAA